jgi:hypothetical protein
MPKDIDTFFFLLSAGLWGNGNPDIRIDGTTDWQEVYRLATEQSVLGLVLAGIEAVQGSWLKVNGSPLVPQMLLLQWIGEVQLIEQRNKEMNDFVAKLIEKLRKHDVYAILVKGQGVAQCYEKPLWRTCGDVDLLLSGDNYDKAKSLLMPLASEVETEYVQEKHLGMTIDGFVVELHGTLHVGLSAKVEKGLDEIKRAIFYEGKVRSVALDVNDNLNDNGTTKSFKSVQIFLPAANEDVVYVFAHMLQHFFKEGLGLRQVCDWCRLLYTYRDSLNYGLLESRIRKMGLMSEWRAFGAFAVEYLGMPAEAIPFLNLDANVDFNHRLKKKADRICDFILEVGNMGHNRDTSYFEKYPYLIRKVFSMGRRCGDLIRHARIFPLDSLRFFPRIIFNGLRSAVRGE